MKHFLLLIFFMAFCTELTDAADNKVTLTKSQVVTCTIPQRFFHLENASLKTGALIYVVDIDTYDGKTLSIQGDSNWKRTGFPLVSEVFFEKVKSADRYNEVEFRSAAVYLKLRFDKKITDLNSALLQTIYPGNSYNYLRSKEFQELSDIVLPKVFSGSLASIPREQQLQLVSTLAYNTSSIYADTFKGNEYLVIECGKSNLIYNTIQMNQAARTAAVTNDSVIPLLKILSPFFKGNNELHGIKLIIDTQFKDFVRESYLIPYTEKVEFFITLENIKKFQNFDITNQQLADSSMIIVNGSRIQVDLTSR